MEYSALTVAQWFLAKQSVSHKKLQKLCYYAQAWHLALLGRPLFYDDIQAWVHGPVIPSIYAKYADYGWNPIPAPQSEAPIQFSEDTTQVLEIVWNTYKHLDGEQLEALTHSEQPWQIARQDIPLFQPSNNVISCDSMRSFYKKVIPREPK